MNESKLREFLEANPEYNDILQRIVAYEDRHPDDEYHVGWVFGSGIRQVDVRKLVGEDMAEMSAQHAGSVGYRLTDRELTRKVLGL